MAGFMTVKRLRALLADERLRDDHIALMHHHDTLHFADTVAIAKTESFAEIDFNAEELIVHSVYARPLAPSFNRPEAEAAPVEAAPARNLGDEAAR